MNTILCKICYRILKNLERSRTSLVVDGAFESDSGDGLEKAERLLDESLSSTDVEYVHKLNDLQSQTNRDGNYEEHENHEEHSQDHSQDDNNQEEEYEEESEVLEDDILEENQRLLEETVPPDVGSIEIENAKDALYKLKSKQDAELLDDDTTSHTGSAEMTLNSSGRTSPNEFSHNDAGDF
eukprot:UN27698